MKSQNTKTSSEIQNEVRNELNKVRRDINNFQKRLTPGQIIDDVIYYPHGQSLADTFDHLKRNPIGTSLLSFGTILLMENEKKVTLEKNAKDKVLRLKDGIKDHLPQMTGVKEKASRAFEEGKEKLNYLEPMSFVVLGAGLGALTGASLPVSVKEQEMLSGSMNGKLSEFSKDFKQALNECSNIMKGLVLSEVNDYNINLFR